jgi:tetratricopeptide (TPR) repeat protein
MNNWSVSFSDLSQIPVNPFLHPQISRIRPHIEADSAILSSYSPEVISTYAQILPNPSKDYSESSEKLRKSINQHDPKAPIISTIAKTQEIMAKTEEYIRALEFEENKEPRDYWKIQQICRDLGEIYVKGDYKEAEKFYSRGIGILEQYFSNNLRERSQALKDLAEFYLSSDEKGKRRDTLCKLSVVLSKIAHNEYKVHDFHAAKEYLQECCDIQEEIYSKSNSMLAENTKKLAKVYEKTKDLSKAEEYYLKSMQLYEKTYPNFKQLIEY